MPAAAGTIISLEGNFSVQVVQKKQTNKKLLINISENVVFFVCLFFKYCVIIIIIIILPLQLTTKVTSRAKLHDIFYM